MTDENTFIIMPSKNLMKDKLWFSVFPRYSLLNDLEKKNTNWKITFEDIHNLIKFYDTMKGPFRKKLKPIQYSKGLRVLIQFTTNKSGLIENRDKKELIKILTDKIEPEYSNMKYIPNNDSKYTELKSVINYMCWQNLTDFIYMAIGTFLYYGEHRHFKRLKLYHAFFDIEIANNAYELLYHTI